ncbi:MAG: hypothetical protein AB7Q16_01465 [Vicinamibacterales bacterium]
MRVLAAPTFFMATLALAATPASGQPLGQFRWQQQPYCNVITLTVTQSGGIYQLDGWDDQCGGGTRAAAAGVAFQNPDGSIGFGLTLVTAPGAAALHLDATISLSGLSGTWRDSSGQSGAWTFLQASGPGGPPRPAPRVAFPAGLSAGNARVTDVGPPAAAGDAANRAYVDASVASAHAWITAPLNLTALNARDSTGESVHRGWGCIEHVVDGSSVLELPLPVGARLTTVNAKFTDESGGPVEYLQFRLVRVNFADSLRTETAAVSAVSGNWTGFTTVPLFGSATLNTVRNDQAFYIRVHWPAHAGPLYFCGAQVLFAMP